MPSLSPYTYLKQKIGGIIVRNTHAFENKKVLVIGLAKSGFPSRLRSIVYLRNRCAHYGRLWNHCVIDAGAVPHNVRNKAKRRLAIGNFTPRSIMDVIVSLDDFLKKMNIRSDFLEQFEQLFMLDNDVFRRGMIDPRSTKDRYQH